MKVTMRPATKLPKIIIHRKVAAYCRVSTQQEIQHHSLEAQRYCAYNGRDSICIFCQWQKIKVLPPSRLAASNSPPDCCI